MLLPVFFFLNAFNEYFGDLKPHLLFKLLGYLMLLAAGSYLFALVFFRRSPRLSVASFVVLLYLLFTKNLYRALDNQMSLSVFFITSFIILIASAFIIARGRLTAIGKFNRAVVMILLVLVLYEGGRMIVKAFMKDDISLSFEGDTRFITWERGSKPNIYLLLFDEYQGNEGLKAMFGFDNSSFLDELEQKGFRILQKPTSNYNYTYYSMPSMFAMGFLRFGDSKMDLDYKRVVKSINSMDASNRALGYLADNGYSIRNHSLFDILGERSPYSFDGLDEDAFAVLFSRTLPGWIKTDLLHKSGSNGVHRFAKDLYYRMYEYNGLVLRDTRRTIDQAANGPQFVYSHFLLPHLPVLTDSSGNLKNIGEAASELHFNSPSLSRSYLEYVRHANAICGTVTTGILAQDPGAVIIIASDHGLRRLYSKDWVHNIQMAVKMPGSDHSGYYDGMSLVNVFRVLLNRISGQRFSMLPDSTVTVK